MAATELPREIGSQGGEVREGLLEGRPGPGAGGLVAFGEGMGIPDRSKDMEGRSVYRDQWTGGLVSWAY